MIQKRGSILAVVIGLFVALSGRPLWAQTADRSPDAPVMAPALISFQGFLSDGNGNP